MKKLALATAAALSLVSFSADAHGPSRRKVQETVEINAPADKVWSVMGNFQDMSWLPVVEKTEGTGGNEPNKAKRTLTLKGGGTVEEELDKYADKQSYFYRIDKVDVKVLPVNNYSSTIEIEPAGDKTKVTWRGAFYRGYMNNDPPPELNDEAAEKAVKGLYRTGLDALKAKVEKGS
ncbi:SRPBCC family protein [Methylobacterium sp. sgz302541]|uniref:SRPBCC family protein n=1 Tax=unclassified Methylobacterium TaxID=2615210 RepID=UPI003D34B470